MRNKVRAASQLRNVACVFVVAATVALTSLLLVAFQVVNTADSVKVAESIACFAVLLVVASTYSFAAILWNVYWTQQISSTEKNKLKIEPKVGGWWISPNDDACILIDTECHGDYDHPDCAVVVVPGKNSSAREGDLLRFTELKDTSCDPIIQSGWSPIVLTAQTTLSARTSTKG